MMGRDTPGSVMTTDTIRQASLTSFSVGVPPRTGTTQNGDEGSCCAAASGAAKTQIKPASIARGRMAGIVLNPAEQRISFNQQYGRKSLLAHSGHP
jgi:hypothetical protein